MKILIQSHLAKDAISNLKSASLLVLVALLNSAILFADSPSHTSNDDQHQDEEDCDVCDQDKQDCAIKQCGEPFYLDTGEFYWENTLLAIEGNPLGLSFDIRYSSFNEYNGFMGNGWMFNYNMRVFETDEGNLVVRKDSGARQFFEDTDTDGTYESQDVRDDTITLGPSGYTLTNRDQMTYSFDTLGRLVEIADTQSNSLVISYEDDELHPVYGLPRNTNLSLAGTTDLAAGTTVPLVVVRDYRLKKVEEYLLGVATGRFLEYAYDTAGSGHLITVIDDNGREVNFTYDGDVSNLRKGDLIQIEDELGLDYDFTYYSDSGDSDEEYYRFMESFTGAGCSSCSKRWNYYWGGSGSNGKRIKRQTQGSDPSLPLGEDIEVLSYNTGFTQIRYTIREFDLSGELIDIHFRDEQVSFATDAYGESRAKKQIQKDGDISDWNDPSNQVREYFYYGIDDAINPGEEYLDGRISREQKPNGSIVYYDYDANGNLTRKAQDVSATRLLVNEYTYDANNNRTRSETFYEEASLVVGSKFTTVFEYDALNRMTAVKQVKNPGDAEASWQYITTSYTYVGDTSKRLTVTDPLGTLTQYEYNDPNNEFSPSREYDPSNPSRQILYSFDVNGNSASRTDALGNVTLYTYDVKGRLTEETDALGFKTIYTYSSTSPNVISIETGVKTGETSRKVFFQYDELNRQIGQSRLDDSGVESPQWKVSYNSEGRIVQKEVYVSLDSAGVPTATVLMEENSYDAHGRLISSLIPHPDGDEYMTFEYDAAGRQTAMIEPYPTDLDPGGTVRSESQYDYLDRLTVRTEAVGSAIERSMSYEYLATGGITNTTYSDGTVTQVSRNYYDDLGRLTGVNWDPAAAQPDASGARELPQRFDYDDNGNVVSLFDGKGNETKFYYDAYSRQVGVNWTPGQALPDTNYEGALPSRTEYDDNDNVLAQYDGRGNAIYRHYDALNRVLHTSVPQASGSSLTGNWWETSANVLHTVAYDGFGNVVSSSNIAGGSTANTYNRFGELVAEQTLEGVTLTYAYNNLGQPLTITYPELKTNEGVSTIAYVYNSRNPNLIDSVADRAGNATSYSYTTRLQQASETSSLGATTVYVYDVLGRLEAQSNHLSETESYVYDQFDQVTEKTFPDLKVQTFAYDNYGRLTSRAGDGEYPVGMGYDLAGNQTTLTTYYGAGSASSVTTWTYNARNQIERKTFADNSFYDYAYDDAGSLSQRTDAKNVTTAYTYNAYNLPTSVDYPTDADTSFAYDDLGRRTQMVDETGTTTWTYYTSNLIERIEQTANNSAQDYQYDSEGNRTSLIVSRLDAPTDTWETVYTYDNAGRLETLLDKDVDASNPFTYAYNANASLVATLDFPTGLQTVRSYDILGRLDMLENFDDTSTALSEFDYDYSVAGLRESETLLDGRQRNFAYDDYYQVEQADLEVADASYDFQYSYDDIGNRLSARDDTVTTTYTPDALNQYDAISGLANPTYDANGSLLAHDGDSYTWNEENRLSRVDKSDGSYVTFLYDGLGRRISKKSYNSSSTLVADTLFEYADFTIIREAESVSSEVKQYTIGNDVANALSGTGGVGAILAMHDGASDYYYFYDGNYNVSQVVDGSSVVVAEYEYSPFGEAIVETGALASDNPIRFSSKYFDDEIDMLYYGYRYYSPELGRWPSRDTIAEQGGYNLYGFVENNPVNNVDFLGNISVGNALLGASALFGQGGGFDFAGPIPGTPVPIPAIGATFNIDWYVSGVVYRCGCDGKGLYAELSVGVEMYLQWGYAIQNPKYSRIDRNRTPGVTDRAGNPWRRNDSKGFRDRDWHVEFGDGYPDCPETGFTGDVYVFVRGSVGAYFGYQFNFTLNYDIEDDFDPVGIWRNSNVQHSVARGIYGASIEMGGGGKGSGKLLLKEDN